MKIVDTLDENVEYVSSEPAGSYDKSGHKVTWELDTKAGKDGFVTLVVKVLPGAAEPKSGHEIGSVINEGTTVKVGNDKEYELEPVENPVPEKTETAPYEGSGLLGFVKVGDEITYRITYQNYLDEDAVVKIVDTLDENVEYVSSEPAGSYDKTGHKVTWELDTKAGKDGYVTLVVKVLPGALESNGGNGTVINEGTTVKVGNDKEYELEPVENPLPEKMETDPYEGTGLLGFVKVGDEITYKITYWNHHDEPAKVTIIDTLDDHVAYKEASDNGEHSGEEAGGVVTWTLKDVPANTKGIVTLTVTVLDSALESN